MLATNPVTSLISIFNSAFFNNFNNYIILTCSTTVPNTWAEYSNRNIQQSQLERTASANMRAEIQSLISSCTNDIWLAWNNTNVSLSERVAETLDSQRKLQAHLSQVSFVFLMYHNVVYITHVSSSCSGSTTMHWRSQTTFQKTCELLC